MPIAGAAPVYKPLKNRSSVMGLGAPEFLKILLILAVGIGSWFATGLWTHAVDANLSQNEALAELTELQALQETAASVQSMFERTGAKTVDELDLTDTDKSKYQQAVSLGITSATERDELVEMIPETKREVRPVVSDPIRAILLIVVPVLLFVAVHIEYDHGCTLIKDVRRVVKNARRPHVYVSRPKVFVKEHADG